METAEVVIVGGGVMGCSLAYHLARAGVDVLLLERETFGSQSTNRCAGGVRQQFSAEVNVRLQRLAVRMLTDFEAEVGVSAEFRQIGYLFLLSDPDDVADFQRQLHLWHRIGLSEARWVTPEEAREIAPAIETDGLLGGTFCPTDGVASPNDVTYGYVAAARRHGARLREGVTATGIDLEHGRVRGVKSDTGDISTGTVFNCAGAWAPQLGHMVGIDLPILPYRRHIFVTDAYPGMTPTTPLTIDFSTSFYFHPEGDGMLFGMGEKGEQPTFNTEVDWSLLEGIGEVASRRAPGLLSVGIKTAWAGLYENTPDHQPIAGPVDGVEGFWCACGFSGHGFQQAPALGLLLAQQLVRGHADLDLSPFAYSRFQRADLQPETNFI